MTAEIIAFAARPRRRVRPAPGLSDQDCFAVAAALRLLPGSWLAQRDEAADGSVAMALFVDEWAAAPVFTVRRAPGGYRLDRGRAGGAGPFGTLRETMLAARRELEN